VQPGTQRHPGFATTTTPTNKFGSILAEGRNRNCTAGKQQQDRVNNEMESHSTAQHSTARGTRASEGTERSRSRSRLSPHRPDRPAPALLSSHAILCHAYGIWRSTTHLWGLLVGFDSIRFDAWWKNGVDADTPQSNNSHSYEPLYLRQAP